MTLPPVNYLAVLVSGIAIFLLGGLWYSPMLFARPWVRLMGKTEEELKAQSAGPIAFVIAFFCGLITAFVLAIVLQAFAPLTLVKALIVSALCWLGFAGVTSFGSAIFSGQPRPLWLINSGYNLVSFLVAATILALWR